MKLEMAATSQLLCLLIGCGGQLALAGAPIPELYINEIFSDPGGSGLDEEDEYIELRGTPGASLADHYLIFIENEISGTANPGVIDNIFDFNAVDAGVPSLGSNGFLTIRQKDSPYTVAPGTTDLVNQGAGLSVPNLPFPPPPGYGSIGQPDGITGGNSTIGASDRPSPGSAFREGKIENGGFTAMLIRNDGGLPPSLYADEDQLVDVDIDTNNDAEIDIDDNSNGIIEGFQPEWVIIDAIGVATEPGEPDSYLYGMVNFGADNVADPNIPAGATYTSTGYEIEYVGRWGNSTGQTAEDWHASNLTDDLGSGTTGLPDWRQSRADPHAINDGDPTTPAPETPLEQLESTQGVPYGTKLADTLGAPNFIFGDFNKDGYVTLADYTVWRDSIGDGVGIETAHPPADPNHDFDVDADDYAIFKANFGAPSAASNGSLVASQVSVPEPASWVLAMSFGAALVAGQRLR